MFKEKDKAFYPSHGVGVIEKIEKKKIDNGEEQFYVIRIIDTDMLVTVPLSKAKEIGLRPLIDGVTAKQVYQKLCCKEDVNGSKKCTSGGTWNRRHRDYMAKLKTGSIFDIVEVFKELTELQSRKNLSFGEKKLYEQVRKLLVKELAFCEGCSEDAIFSRIKSIMNS